MPGKEENSGNPLVTLVDEQGNEHEFLVEDLFECQDKRYAVLTPAPGFSKTDGEEDLEEAYIFRLEHMEGEDVLVEVEDEKEWSSGLQWEMLKEDSESIFEDEG